MPAAEETNTVPGQAYGQRGKQDAYAKATRVEREQVFVPESQPAPEGLEVPGLGDLTNLLLAPTDRPLEALETPARDRSEDRSAATYQSLMQNPNVSRQTRAFLEFLVLSDSNQPGVQAPLTVDEPPLIL